MARSRRVQRLSKSEGFGQQLRDPGVDPRPELLRALVDRDRDLLLATARLYDDSIPFLKEIRARGIKIAIVSNCTEPTRRLLAELGIDVLVDALVLSCEVDAAKPDAEIFRYALDQLGVAAGYWHSATPGSPTTRAATSWTGRRSCARARTGPSGFR